MNLTGITRRTAAAVAWIRVRVTKRRVVRAFLGVTALGTIGVAGEAVVRGRLVPPGERAPSALYTRPAAWGYGDRARPVAIGTVNGSLNERRDPVALRDVPRHLIDAVLSVEDQRFYEHHGLDPRRIVGALLANVRARGVSEGGSTITQQLAKNLFLSNDRTTLRKVRDAALATALEVRHTKAEILEAYLNEIYFGRDGSSAIHGVGAASRYYFGKPVSRISLAESALLAGMIRAPNRLAPTRHAASARARRNLVLALMLAQRRIDSSSAARATRARVSTRAFPATSIDARYFRDFVVRSTGGRLPARGATVYTTLDAALQRSAGRAVARGLGRFARPGAQAALVVIDPRTGDVLAMVGGRNYGASQFNRATDARRQPGSAFKPLVALAALEAHEGQAPAFTLASVVRDEPLAVSTPQGTWRPVDYDGSYRGEVTFREALEQSLNVPFARIGLTIGPERIVATARRLGVTGPLHAVPSIALGSSEVTLLELVRAYGALAAAGSLAETRSIVARRDAGGDLYEAAAPNITQVASPATSFLVTSALMGVVRRGTGRALGERGFGGDSAGKTGTSNDWRDAWFVAYSPEIVVGAWVGHDDGTSLRLSGASAALPIVAEFFSGADVPGERFDVPDGIERGYVSTGLWGWCGEGEYFLEGTAPQSTCGFRVAADDGFAALRELGSALRRAILDRIEEEHGSRRPRRGSRP